MPKAKAKPRVFWMVADEYDPHLAFKSKREAERINSKQFQLIRVTETAPPVKRRGRKK